MVLDRDIGYEHCENDMFTEGLREAPHFLCEEVVKR
jgi:hypothetical protein